MNKIASVSFSSGLDHFTECTETVREATAALLLLAHPKDHLLDELKIGAASSLALVHLETMRDYAAELPQGNRREVAFETISTLSGGLTNVLELLQTHRKRYLSRAEREENTAFYTASQQQPRPTVPRPLYH